MKTADSVVDVDKTLIPTGTIGRVSTSENSYLDFRKPKRVGQDIDKGTVTRHGGYDNAWIFAGWKRGILAKDVAVVHSPISGISVAMSTDQPSVQAYSGNFLNGTDPATRIERKKSQSFGPAKQYYQYGQTFFFFPAVLP